jgi:hypothetical protein
MFDPSGGLRYHWTALRRRNDAWLPHRRSVRTFLSEWAPRASKLILVGPSAGYSLPSEFLAPFQQVLVIEPDPLARRLLTQRFEIGFQWVRSPKELTLQLDRSYAVLFCNMLGQLSLSPAMENPESRGQFHRLAERVQLLCPWASFHDRLSIDGDSVSDLADLRSLDSNLELKSAQRLDADTLALRFLPGARVAYEHDAEEWFPALKEGQNFKYWLWNLRPDQHHVIEATFSRSRT